jgi:phosphate:Na+ symporter
MTEENIEKSFSAVMEASPKYIPEVSEKEEYIDFLNKEISKHLSTLIAHECSEEDSVYISAYFKITGNIERIGDHAINICEYTNIMKEKNIVFSERATKEIEKMKEISLAAVASLKDLSSLSEEELKVASDFEQQIDDLTKVFRQNQIDRIQEKTCSDEACIIYSEMLTDFERIGDHILNIAEALEIIK